LFLPGMTSSAQAQHEGHSDASRITEGNFLSENNRILARTLVMQDFRGRMKPLDTYVRALSMKVTKREHFDGWEPLDLYFSWISDPAYWFAQPVIAVRFQGLKDLLGVSAETRNVSGRSLIDADGQYILSDKITEALRTPDRDRTKLQRKLISFDERFNLFYNAISGGGVRLFPIPDDPDHTWLEYNDARENEMGGHNARFTAAVNGLLNAMKSGDNARIHTAMMETHSLQEEFGADVLPGDSSMKAEMWLNSNHPFRNVTMPYLVACGLLLLAFFWNIGRMSSEPYSWKHPLYLLGLIVYWASTLYLLFAYVLRWIASGRAPLSNGYESLIFIALSTAIAGMLYEFTDRRGSTAGVSALMTTVILSVAMLSTFDPAIGPLVPVLASYWLNIHVTIITGSYGFLGLGSLLGALTMILFLMKGPGRTNIQIAILKLTNLNHTVLVTGLGLLAVGTLLGGVWANESWGRYWGWDPKETWSLVTILVYAFVTHLRWVPALNKPWLLAATSFAAIGSIIMTYFGVNYFLSGLHSYAQGEAAQVPDWVFIFTGVVVALCLTSWLADRFRSWQIPSK
jgi:cytochrome c-type biogenesis protein CcsB